MSKTSTRGRRQDQTAPVVEAAAPTYLLEGAGLLDHGLDDGTFAYVWANRLDNQDLNTKLRAGFSFVKYQDVRQDLLDRNFPIFAYREDEAGNLTYGVDLILMRGHRADQAERIRRALLGQASTVRDAGLSDFSAQLDDFLSTKPIRRADAPRVSKDDDHGEVQRVEL